jgi:hypothetical protein
LAGFFVDSMADSATRRQPSKSEPSSFSTPAWQVLKKRRWQLIAASVLLAIWIGFLVAMAAYN